MAISPWRRFLKKHGITTLVVLLFVFGSFLRLYNFRERLIFGPEQAISLLTSASYLDKFSLLGEINVQRATSTGLNPFHGAYFNYFLVPFILLFNYQPLPITYIFAFLNLLTAFIFYLVCKKIFGQVVAIFSLFYFLFSALMIHHSLFIWNLNFLPLLGILALYALFKLSKSPKKLTYPFWVGIIGGVGFGLQYLFLPFILLTGFLSIYFSKSKIKAILFFIIGATVGGLSMVLFDLRHDFYYTRTLWQYLMDVLNNKVSGGMHYYDFMYLLPYLLLAYALLTRSLYERYKPLCLVPLLLFVAISFRSPVFDLYRSTGVVDGITLSSLESAAAIIAQDMSSPRFNVVTLWDFDTRAHTLRYFLTYYYERPPLGVEEYRDLDTLYAFAPEGYNIYEPQVYELSAFSPYQVAELPSPSKDFKLYKLTK